MPTLRAGRGRCRPRCCFCRSQPVRSARNSCRPTRPSPQMARSAQPTVKTSRQDYENWWAAFRDPTLNRLVDIAYDQNLTLMAAGTRVHQGAGDLGEAIGEVYPQIPAARSETRDTSSPAAPTRRPTQQRPRQGFLAGQARRPGRLGARSVGQVPPRRRIGRCGLSRLDRDLRRRAGHADRRCRDDYIGIRTLQAQIAIARENVVKQKEALEIARDRFKGGATSELDVFQAENVLAQTEGGDSATHGANAERPRTRCASCSACRRPRSTGCLRRSRGIPAPPRDVAVGIPAELLRRRPDVRAAELKAAAQSAQIGMAEADLYPAFSLERRARHAGQHDQRQQPQQAVHRAEHHLRFRTVVQLADPQLRPDHQQRARRRTPSCRRC